VTLRSRLSLAAAYVVLLAVVSLAVPLIITFRDRVDGEVRQQANGQADVVAATAADLLAPRDRATLRTLVRSAAGPAHGRVIVVDAGGRLLADSGQGPLGADYSLQRPEVASALRGRRVQERRFSDTLNAELLATAVPIASNGRTVGAVRITQPVAAVQRAVRRSALSVVAVAIAVLAMGILAGVLVAGGIVRPLRRLEATARRIAGGDLDERAPIEGSAEQRSLARSFNAMTDRLAALVAARERFVADASHQLRTPLTGVRLRLEEARALSDSTDAARELDAGMKEVDRLAAIVDDLLVLGTSGAGPAAEGPIDLADAVRRAAARWEPQAAAAGITLRVGSDGGLAPGRGLGSDDADRVLDVLIENAIRYAPGRPVELSAAPGRLEVRDHGPGLAAGEEAAVLERFHRGSAGRAAVAEGSGLGLAIAADLVAAAGGELTLANAPDGEGALARVALPGEAGA
jgi:two-component system, OmpR family, sensor kinase